MTKVKYPKGKLMFLILLIGIYILFGVVVKGLVMTGKITPLPPQIEDQVTFDPSREVYLASINLQNFMDEKLVRKDGHVNLYYSPRESLIDEEYTNSEAISYYALWKAEAGDKRDLDLAVDFAENKMLHEQGYLMWKLNRQDAPVEDGMNIASDADLRLIKALFVAEDKWEDGKYGELRNTLTAGLEDIAITEDNLFAPYGGYSGSKVWKTNEVWLSYADFEAFRTLADKNGQPWRAVYNNMKKAVIEGQLENGLYNTQLNENREYHNTLDNNEYSINSLWVMVRAAESKDPELEASAEKALEFYKKKYAEDGVLYTSYDSTGEAASNLETPWVYALVARAAISLGDESFSEDMILKLLEFQEKDENSEFYGAIVEGSERNRRVSQFTMQESIITLQAYQNN